MKYGFQTTVNTHKIYPFMEQELSWQEEFYIMSLPPAYEPFPPYTKMDLDFMKFMSNPGLETTRLPPDSW